MWREREKMKKAGKSRVSFELLGLGAERGGIGRRDALHSPWEFHFPYGSLFVFSCAFTVLELCWTGWLFSPAL